MVKRCVKSECNRKAAFVCKCKGKSIFMCKKHPAEHLMSKGNHEIMGLLYKPDDQEAKEIRDNFVDNLSKIRKIKNQTLDNTKKILEQTLKLSNELIAYLEDLENRFLTVYKNINSHKEIDIQDVEKFMNLSDCDENLIFDGMETIIKNLTSFYNIDPCIKIEKALFLDTSLNSQLSALNLITFISCPFNILDENEVKSSLNIQTGFSLCKTEKQTNCIISGSFACLIDMEKNHIKLLPNVPVSNGLCGLVCKDECIYAFLGNCNIPSYKLKIITMEWENISNFPIQLNYRRNAPCFNYGRKMNFQNNLAIQGTASITNNNIVIASSYLNGLYHYDEISNSYAKVLDLNANNYNYSMENWIVSGDGNIYENIGPLLSDFKSYQNFMTIGNLSVYGSFTFKGYIYFMENTNSLMRINCAQKKVEVVQYKTKT